MPSVSVYCVITDGSSEVSQAENEKDAWSEGGEGGKSSGKEKTSDAVKRAKKDAGEKETDASNNGKKIKASLILILLVGEHSQVHPAWPPPDRS